MYWLLIAAAAVVSAHRQCEIRVGDVFSGTFDNGASVTFTFGAGNGVVQYQHAHSSHDGTSTSPERTAYLMQTFASDFSSFHVRDVSAVPHDMVCSNELGCDANGNGQSMGGHYMVEWSNNCDKMTYTEGSDSDSCDMRLGMWKKTKLTRVTPSHAAVYVSSSSSSSSSSSDDDDDDHHITTSSSSSDDDDDSHHVDANAHGKRSVQAGHEGHDDAHHDAHHSSSSSHSHDDDDDDSSVSSYSTTHDNPTYERDDDDDAQDWSDDDDDALKKHDYELYDVTDDDDDDSSDSTHYPTSSTSSSSDDDDDDDSSSHHHH